MKIIVTAGGTYGHITPALSLISALKKKNIDQIIFVSPNRELKEILSRQNIKTYFIANPKIIKTSIFSLISSFFKLVKAISSCFSVLLKLKPQAVIGFGGYAAFPLLISACILRVPSAIHEQNVVMGRANRILSNFVKGVFISFEETKRFFNRKKVVLVGNPIRQELKIMNKKDALRYLGLSEDLFTILVLGGSLGSHKINEKFVATLKYMNGSKLQIIHITGQNDFEYVKGFYDKFNSNDSKQYIKNRVFSFSDKMSYLFSAADLIISRAGASTIAEISYFRIPSILVPYPYARAHQLENANILTNRQQAIMIEDNDLYAEALAVCVNNFIQHPEKLFQMRQRFKQNNYNSADRLADEVLRLS